ncbi:F0F1 ATP synthase subunit B family protein [Terricaulis silvestris]|uniref:ATP synthase subunit b n=1 Tax=Terricaulis silvestris TaxID=2686094 RepID=A0A6I6MQU0_9CAUL|nr:ATP F0F1 synthase subunit B [Terricaulis silvestris]QGZ95788.1 F-type ATPase subunit b [Terricaulis silvestris]
MTFDATFFAFVAFAIFFAVLIYLKIPATIMSALDARSAEIAKELHEARRLREEAEKLLADYQAKKATAEAEAKAIVASAKEQAAAVAEETRVSMIAAMARREKQADDRIASAGTKASDEVRAAAAEAAIAAAERLIRERMNDTAQAGLVAEGVSEMTKRKFG